MPAPERLPSPLSLRARPVQGVGPGTAAMRQRGIVSDSFGWGKRKMCEGIHRRSHLIHNISTSTKIVQKRINFGKSPPILLLCCDPRKIKSLVVKISPEENFFH
jgi:hypothetical protein